MAVAAGVGLLLVGGAGGYALGHATAGSGASTVREHRGGPDGFRGVPGGADDNGVNGGTGPST